MTVADHNAERWLQVVYLEECPPAWKARRHGGVPGWVPGWYVQRTCPCCQGEPVTWTGLDSEAEAQRALAGMLRSAKVMGT